MLLMMIDIFDDSDGVDTVYCLVTLPSSLDSPSADATDHMFYAVDVCNCFSSLSREYPSDGVQSSVQLY